MISSLGWSVLAVVVEAAARALLLAAIVGVAMTILRVKRPRLLLWCWTIVLTAGIAMPLLTSALPKLPWIIPDLSRVPVASAALSWSLDPAGPQTNLHAAASTNVAPALPWRDAVVLIYLTGTVILLLRGLRSWLRARALANDARPIGHLDAITRMHHLASHSGVSRFPLLYESSTLRVPVTMSVTTPAIVLPRTWRTWDGRRLDAVLAHELAHVAQRDTLIQRASLLYRAIVWFSPLSWWLHARLAELAEQASDEAALSAGARRAEYAETLLAFFAEVRQSKPCAGWHVAMARGAAHNAERRVDRILNWKGSPTMKLSKKVLIGAAVAVTPAAVAAASIQPWLSPRLPVPELIAVQAEPAPPATKERREPVPASQTEAPRISRKTTAPVVPLRSSASPVAVQTPKADDDFAAGAYAPDTPGLVRPELLRSVEPKYTSDALRAKLQGTVELDMVIDADGNVSRARVATSKAGSADPNPTYQFAGYESQAEQLNAEALKAARQFSFIPGKLNGVPVPVVVTLTISFRLH